MGFSATVSGALSSVWSGIETGGAFVYNNVSAGVIWAGHSVQAGISGPVVSTVGSIWTSAGPVLGPVALVVGIGITALAGRHLFNKPKPEDTNATTALYKISGVALAIVAGVATAGFVGVAAGTVGVAAYAAGGAVSLGTLLL